MLSWLLRRRMAGIETSGIPSDGDTVHTKKRNVESGRTDGRILRRPSNDIITSLLPSSFVRVRSTIMENIFDGYLNKQCSEI